MLASTYALSEVLLFSSGTTESAAINVTPNIIEASFYEEINKPYVHASLVLVDDFNFRGMAAGQGTEFFKISISDLENNKVISEKYYAVASIDASLELTDRSDAILINLVEEHVFVSQSNKISRSYTGTLDTIVERIVSSELGLQLHRYLFEETAQGSRKIVVPYMTPLDAANWVKQRATSKSGFPYHLYSSLFGKNALRMTNLEAVMKSQPINVNFPLNYTKASSDSFNDPLKKSRTIKKFKEMKTDPTLSLLERGGFGSSYTAINLDNGIAEKTHFSGRNILDQFVVDNLIQSKYMLGSIDPYLTFNDKLADQYESPTVYQVSLGKTYSESLNYHEDNEKLKMKGEIVKLILSRNPMDVLVDSFMFFMTRMSVANKIRMIFLNNDLGQPTTDLSRMIDKRRSGDYLLTAVRHDMSQTETNTSFSAIKIDDLPANKPIIPESAIE